MASVSLHDLGLDRLSIEERLQLADAIWDSVVHDVETSPLPEWQRAELQRRLADSIANPMPCGRGAMSKPRHSHGRSDEPAGRSSASSCR